MTWPTVTVSTANVDAPTDNPASARADLLDLIQKANQMIQDGFGRLIGVRIFNTPGSSTYTPTAGTNSVLVQVQAGGGGGGGVFFGTGGNGGVAGGGGAGGYAESLLTSGFSGVTITVGGGGNAGSVFGGSGQAGGSSSFGSLVVASGGAGGLGETDGRTGVSMGRIPGAGGGATAGQIRVKGAPGGWGMMQNASGGRSGEGAASRFGCGGAAVILYSAGGSVWGMGENSPSLGAGGSGGVYFLSVGGTPGPNAPGGYGGQGVVVVYEYT